MKHWMLKRKKGVLRESDLVVTEVSETSALRLCIPGLPAHPSTRSTDIAENLSADRSAKNTQSRRSKDSPTVQCAEQEHEIL